MAQMNLVETSVDAIYRAYERRAAEAFMGDDDWRREHLGASILGHKCDRYLWLSFRWALEPARQAGRPDVRLGQQLRLFERGKIEEALVIRDLRAAGFTVVDRDADTGEQIRVRYGAHVGGSLDGIVSGLLEAPKTDHVLEVKTHNQRSFERVRTEGVKRAKPEHWVQAQVYMRLRGLERCFYVAVHKDTDDIFAERIHADRVAAAEALRRGTLIVNSTVPPTRLDPSCPPCKYVSREGKEWPCQFFDLCHGQQTLPAKNCRTCISSTPVELADGTGAWNCDRHGVHVSPAAARRGCREHVTVPDMINKMACTVDVSNRRVTYVDGTVDGAGTEANNQMPAVPAKETA